MVLLNGYTSACCHHGASCQCHVHRRYAEQGLMRLKGLNDRKTNTTTALVTSWRNDFDPANPGVEDASIGFPDPKWCLGLNGASLACGFVGNIFLLFNFTRAVRYIVALPATIILWYFATGIVCRSMSHHSCISHRYPCLGSFSRIFIILSGHTSLSSPIAFKVYSHILTANS